MDNSPTPANVPAKDQREALEDSVEKATENQPGEFKDESNKRKVVDIGDDVTDAPIKGIDP